MVENVLEGFTTWLDGIRVKIILNLKMTNGLLNHTLVQLNVPTDELEITFSKIKNYIIITLTARGWFVIGTQQTVSCYYGFHYIPG